MATTESEFDALALKLIESDRRLANTIRGIPDEHIDHTLNAPSSSFTGSACELVGIPSHPTTRKLLRDAVARFLDAEEKITGKRFKPCPQTPSTY